MAPWGLTLLREKSLLGYGVTMTAPALLPSESLKTEAAAFLGALGVGVDSISISQGARVVIAVTSPDSKLLIGPHGEHLQALNMLLRRLIEQKYGEEAANFLLDVNGYHEARLGQLRENAKLLAQRARLFKHDVEMSPMSAYERLVIHELFTEDSEIETHSEGEGKMRHIVLKYKSSATEFGSEDELAKFKAL